MKRKFLEDLGLETDAIEKIMAEAGKDVTSLKARALPVLYRILNTQNSTEEVLDEYEINKLMSE